MKQLLDLCASILEETDTPRHYLKNITQSIHVESHNRKVIINRPAEAMLTVFSKQYGTYTETTVNLKQYTDRPPVEVIEELTNIALKEWGECTSEYLIDNKIKNLLKK